MAAPTSLPAFPSAMMIPRFIPCRLPGKRLPSPWPAFPGMWIFPPLISATGPIAYIAKNFELTAAHAAPRCIPATPFTLTLPCVIPAAIFFTRLKSPLSTISADLSPSTRKNPRGEPVRFHM